MKTAIASEALRIFGEIERYQEKDVNGNAPPPDPIRLLSHIQCLAEMFVAIDVELNQTKDELAWVKQWIELHEREAVLVRPSAPPWETF